MNSLENDISPLEELRKSLEVCRNDVPTEVLHSDDRNPNKLEELPKVAGNWWFRVHIYMENHIIENPGHITPDQQNAYLKYLELQRQVWTKPKILKDKRGELVVKVEQEEIEQANKLIRQFLGITEESTDQQ